MREQIVSVDTCPNLQWSMRISTGSSGIGASTATNTCSTLNNPFALARMQPITGPSLPFFMLQEPSMNLSLKPAFNMCPIDTMVRHKSGAYKVSLRSTQDDDMLFGT